MTRRIPRILGLTALCQSYHKEKTQENKDKVLNHILKSYINQNFEINNKPVTIDQIAYYIKESTEYVMSKLTEGYQVFSNFSNSVINGFGANLTSQQQQKRNQHLSVALPEISLNWAFADRAYIQSQLALLLSDQNGAYTPYLTAEVTKTLDLMLKSNRQIPDLLKAIQGSNPTTIIQNNQLQNVSQEANQMGANFITLKAALDLISEHIESPKTMSLIASGPNKSDTGTDKSDTGSGSKALDRIWAEEGLSGTPEVVANTAGETHYQEELSTLKSQLHENRRSQEYQILDSDDNIPE